MRARLRYDDVAWEKGKAVADGSVAIKLEEMKTRTLAWDPDDYTKETAEEGSEDNAAKKYENGRAEAKAEDGDDVGSDELAGSRL
ncbi:hypothetical protein BDW62DRAFT_201037 [Aspergillus aurantiobrunneus]